MTTGIEYNPWIFEHWNRLWDFLKCSTTVTVIRTAGALSSVLAATIAIFIDAEAIKRKASAHQKISLRKLAREAWADRFVRQVFLFILVANAIFLFGDYLKDKSADDTQNALRSNINKTVKDASDTARKSMEDKLATVTDSSKTDIKDAVSKEITRSKVEIGRIVNSATTGVVAQETEINKATSQTLDAILDGQYAFEGVQLGLYRTWDRRETHDVPKACNYLSKIASDLAKDGEAHEVHSTDPKVAQGLAADGDLLADKVVIDDLVSTEVVAAFELHSKYHQFHYPKVFGGNFLRGKSLLMSRRTPGAFEVDDGFQVYEISFSYLFGFCGEEVRVYSFNTSSFNPLRTAHQLPGLHLDVQFLRRELLNGKFQSERAVEKDQPWILNDIQLGDYDLEVSYDTLCESVCVKKSEVERRVRYGYDFPPDWLATSHLLTYRPDRRVDREAFR